MIEKCGICNQRIHVNHRIHVCPGPFEPCAHHICDCLQASRDKLQEDYNKLWEGLVRIKRQAEEGPEDIIWMSSNETLIDYINHLIDPLRKD